MIPRRIPKWARALALKGSPGFLRDFSEYSGSPDGSQQATQGALCFDVDNDDVYINTDGATAWTKIID